MSTRCQIGIYSTKETQLEKFDALLYRHSDGYPEGVLPDIIPFLENWHNGRGMDDTEYLAARLLQWLCNEYDCVGFKNGYSEYEGKKASCFFTGSLGHGISKDFHGDIEYFYAISPGLVRVYECGYDASPKSWTLIQEITISK